jgi:hypothetical protein
MQLVKAVYLVGDLELTLTHNREGLIAVSFQDHTEQVAVTAEDDELQAIAQNVIEAAYADTIDMQAEEAEVFDALTQFFNAVTHG